jgi:hypothetical protein
VTSPRARLTPWIWLASHPSASDNLLLLPDALLGDQHVETARDNSGADDPHVEIVHPEDAWNLG